CMQGIEYPATF
nr:immunoglobulin light chain junction region [Macaca mulatta]